MENTINQRISIIIEKLGYKSRRSFAERIGIAQTSLNALINGAEPKHSTLYKILEAEPLISAEWLITGRGPMFKSDVSPSEASSNADKELIQRLQIENNLLKQIVGVNNPLQKGESA